MTTTQDGKSRFVNNVYVVWMKRTQNSMKFPYIKQYQNEVGWTLLIFFSFISFSNSYIMYRVCVCVCMYVCIHVQKSLITKYLLPMRFIYSKFCIECTCVEGKKTTKRSLDVAIVVQISGCFVSVSGKYLDSTSYWIAMHWIFTTTVLALAGNYLKR